MPSAGYATGKAAGAKTARPVGIILGWLMDLRNGGP